jgi:hypothetical protein
MQRILKSLAFVLFLTVFSSAIIISCGRQANQDHPADEHPADSTEHPADSSDNANEHPEHPKDSTKN